MADPVRDPIPTLAREVIDLYRDALSDVRFPDVDRARLDESERALLDAQCALEDAEAALEKARAEVAERATALSGRVQRALAYARVFAEDDPALHDRVESIARMESTTHPRLKTERVEEGVATPKRRGRPRKVGTDGATLFAPSDGAESAEHEPVAIDLAS